LPIATL